MEKNLSELGCHLYKIKANTYMGFANDRDDWGWDHCCVKLAKFLYGYFEK